MNKRLLSLCAALLLLCGCGQTPSRVSDPDPTPVATPVTTPAPVPKPTVLEVCVGTEGYTLDPTYCDAEVSADYMTHLFEGLLKYLPQEGAGVTEAVLAPGMAERWERSDEGLTYTFYLREDAVWSDGEPVRAQDFVYAWQRLLTPTAAGEQQHAAAAAQLIGVIRNAAAVAAGELPPSLLGVRAVSDKVLEVQLEQPCSHFLKLCAAPCLLPLREDVITAHGGDWTKAEHMVVNGAFTLEELVHDDHMTLRANPLYYDAAAIGPEAILWRFSDGDETGLEGLHFVADVADETAEGWGSSPRAGTYYLYLNVNNVQNWKVRAAMVLAVDRDAIAAAVGSGASAAVGMIPTGIAQSDGTPYAPSAEAAEQPLYGWLQKTYPKYDLNTYEGRCALARRLMDEAVSTGSWYRSYRLYYRFNESTVNRLVAETCQKNWREVLGVQTEFSLVSGTTYANSLRNGSFSAAYLGWLPDYNDPQSMLEIMTRGGDYNHSAWGDGNYTAAVRAVTEEYDPSARDAMQQAADAMLFSQDRFAVCPVFFYGDSYCVAEGVSNVGHNGMGGYSFHYVTFD